MIGKSGRSGLSAVDQSILGQPPSVSFSGGLPAPVVRFVQYFPEYSIRTTMMSPKIQATAKTVNP